VTARPMRLFVAIYPPEETRRAMMDVLRTMNPPPDPRHRLTPTDQVHMTVQFIGDTADCEVDNVIESVSRSASGVGGFQVKPRRLITLPERGPVRLIAMETDAPAPLLELHRRLAMRLAKTPRAKTGDRFLPHLTLCRFSGEARAERVDHAVALDPFRVESLGVMRSILKPTGAEHIRMAEIPL
jgi:RNA 2',3'-cyclic 3'-phosphodiesterase